MKLRSMMLLLIGTLIGIFLGRRHIELKSEKEGEGDEEPVPGTCKPNLHLV